MCWTVCCLTYTTYSTVHIHSFHKKYILVYTAFTISYNRAVAGTSVWMDIFVTMMQRPQNASNQLIIQRHYPIIICRVFTSHCVLRVFSCSPGAVSLVILPSVSVFFVGVFFVCFLAFAAACPSVLSAVMPVMCHPYCWAPVTSFQAVGDKPSLFYCILPSSSQLPASVTHSLYLVSC